MLCTHDNCSPHLHAAVLDAEVEAEEKVAVNASWKKNAKLGRFTNFVNLLDLAAVAVPSGVLHCRPNVGATGAHIACHPGVHVHGDLL